MFSCTMRGLYLDNFKMSIRPLKIVDSPKRVQSKPIQLSVMSKKLFSSSFETQYGKKDSPTKDVDAPRRLQDCPKKAQYSL